MKTNQKIIGYILLIAVLLYGGYQVLARIQNKNPPIQPSEAVLSEAVRVSVETVRCGDIRNVISVTGEVRPLISVDVVPKIPGRLDRLRSPDRILIEEGVNVEKGSVVAVIEHAQLDAAVRSAQATLEVARAAHEAAKVNLNDCTREKERWINLRKQGAGTQQQLDQVMTAFERAGVQVKQTQAQIAQAEAALEQAEVRLEEAFIKAPISGLVSRKYVDEGAFVGPATPLFKIIDINEVEITGGVADRYYPKLRTRQTAAQVEVDAYPGEVFTGVLTRIRPELDQITRTVVVTIRVPNQTRKLKPGMYARISLVIDQRKDVALVSDDALMNVEGETMVYLVNSESLHSRHVKIGLEEGAVNEVVEGLKPGDRVVIKAHQLLREGMKVEAREDHTR